MEREKKEVAVKVKEKFPGFPFDPPTHSRVSNSFAFSLTFHSDGGFSSFMASLNSWPFGCCKDSLQSSSCGTPEKEKKLL